MKEDNLFIVLFVSLLAILILGLMPKYSPEGAVTGAAVYSIPSGTELWIGLAIITILIIITVVAFFLKKRKSKFESLISESPIIEEQPKMPIEEPKTDEERLQNYIQLSLSQGKSKSQIRHTLIAVGWPNKVIEKVIKEL